MVDIVMPRIADRFLPGFSPLSSVATGAAAGALGALGIATPTSMPALAQGPPAMPGMETPQTVAPEVTEGNEQAAVLPVDLEAIV